MGVRCNQGAGPMMRTGAVILLAMLAATVAAWPAPTGGGTAGHLESPAAEPFDFQAFIDSQVKAGTRQIIVPHGRYRVKPRDQQHLVLHDLQDVTIIADGVEMVCTETTRAVTLTHCRSVTLRGLVIDYDPLPFAQGRITAMSANKKTHDIELFDGYPGAEAVRPFKYEIFCPDTRTLRCDDRYPSKVDVVDPRHIRVHNTGGRASDPEQVGDLIVIGTECAPHGSIPHAVECDDSANVRLENITLYASNCFGFFEENCDGDTYDHCRVDRRPAADDPVKRGDARLRSLDADAFHSKYAVKGPAYVACMAKFMGDDAINICGDYHMISVCQGNTLRVLAKERMNVAAGDPVELLAYDGTRLPDAKAVKVERDGAVDKAEKAFLQKQQMDEEVRAECSTKAYKVTLDRAVDLPRGSLLASAARQGSGFLVQGCDFGFNRSRGILIKASRGKVIGNKLTANWMEAIKVAPEYWWLESGSSDDVEITDNMISDCRTTGIAVYAEVGTGQPAPAGVHNRIVVTGNTLTDCPMPNIFVSSTKEVRIDRNTCISPQKPRRPEFGLDPAKLQPVMTQNCTDATVVENTTK